MLWFPTLTPNSMIYYIVPTEYVLWCLHLISALSLSSLSRSIWHSSMLNIGQWCSLPRAEAKEALGSIHMIYALLQYPFLLLIPSPPPPIIILPSPFFFPVPPTHPFPPTRPWPLPHIFPLPKTCVYPCLRIHPPNLSPSYMGIPGPPLPTTALVPVIRASSPYLGIYPEWGE